MVWIIIAQPDFFMGYLPLYIAKELKDFELLNTGNDDTSIQSVVEGRADMSVGDPIMFNLVKYDKVKVIKGFINRPFVWMITFNPFLKDISKKTLVTAPNPSTTYHFAKKLQKKHKLLLYETPFNTELGPLLTQEADIGLVNEPVHTEAEMNGARTIMGFTDVNMAFTGFCSKKRNENFFKTLQKAIDIFKKDDKTTLEVSKKYFPLKEDVLKQCINNIRELNMYSLKFTKKEIETAMQLKGLNTKKYSRFIDLI